MRDEDIAAVETLLRRHPEVVPEDIVLLSPSTEESTLVPVLYPGAIVREYGLPEWDLDEPGPQYHHEALAIACNTFMCSPDPELWLGNLRAAGIRHLAVQDNARAKRRHDRQLSPETGDIARYSVSSHGVIGVTDPGHPLHDLSALRECTVIDCVRYEFDQGAGTKFAALLLLHDRGETDMKHDLPREIPDSFSERLKEIEGHASAGRIPVGHVARLRDDAAITND